MNILFISAYTDFLVPEIQKHLSPEQNKQISFYDEFKITPEEADIIFMDYSLSTYKELFYDVLKHKKKVAIMIVEDDYNEINTILYKTGVNHLFTISENQNRINFIADISEFIVNWSTEWGTSKIIPSPKHMTSKKIVTSKNIDQDIQDLLKGHDFTNCFEDLPSCISNIINEGLSNALFNAPVDTSGNYLYRNLLRSETVTMLSGKEVEVSLFTDEKSTVISIKDFYGTLTENNIFDYPPLIGENRKNGMRLGMYLIFRYGHKYIINVVKKRSTENIVIIENSRRFKTYDVREKSFHFFLKENISV